MEIGEYTRPKAWERDDAGEVRLLATYDPGEKRYIFPPLSKHLQAGDAELRSLPNVGRLYTYTLNPPNPKRGTPQRAFALVDFPEQNLRVFGRLRLESDSRPSLDSPVKVLLEEYKKDEDYIFVCLEGN